MAYDLVIKNGTVIDGSGLPRYPRRRRRARTAGSCRSAASASGAREVIDADGQVVAPGFVDGHTHMDAQVFWDPLGTSSCWHGITSVVMGNCGFTLAPCAEKDKHLVVRNLQRAEDIPPAAMEAGIKWTLDHLPRVPRRARAAAQGHQLRGLRRPLRAAHVRHGRARLRGGPRPRTICARWSASCAMRCAPAPWASPPRARRATRRRTAARWPAAWRAGTRCGGWSA